MARAVEGEEALREALHAASLDPPQWCGALQALARHVAGEAGRAVGALTIIEGPPPGTGWLLAGVPEAERVYPLDAATRHPLFLAHAPLPEGFVGDSATLADLRGVAGSTLAREHLRDDGTLHGTSAVICTTPFVAAVHILGRRGGGPWEEGSAERLRAVLPEVRRAVEVYLRVRALRIAACVEDALLDQLDVAALALAPSGRILRANTAAQALLHRSDGILSVAGTLCGALDSTTAALREATLQVLRGEVRDTVVIVPRTSNRRPLLLFLSVARDATTGATLAITVIARDAEPHGPRTETLLRSLFGLTPTEARLAVAIAEGNSPAEAADLLGISVLTARTHLKRVFSKTATTRQADLVRLVLTEFPPVKEE